MARIVFDLDGTLAGFIPSGRGTRLAGNPKMIRVAQNLRRQGHTVILWTFGNREWWRQVRREIPELRRLFHEVYTRDDFLHHVTKRGGEPEAVKDIRVIDGDVLVDNEPAHHEWARRHGLEKQYVLVKTFGVEAA